MRASSIAGGHVAAINVLLDFKAALGLQEGRPTPMQLAVDAGRLEVVQLLVEEGAPLEVADDAEPLVKRAVCAGTDFSTPCTTISQRRG